MRTLSKTLKIVGNILLAILVFIAIISITTFAQSKITKDKTPGIGSYRFFAVLSGSMDPTFKVYDMIIDKKVIASKLKPGDVITFKDGDSIVTHRIVKTIGNGSEFVTKGDANNVEDEMPVASKNIISKYLFRLPYMGLIVSKIKGPLGLILIWIVFIIAMISEFTSKKFNKRERRKNRLARRREIMEENTSEDA